jgi:hypothetical protein
VDFTPDTPDHVPPSDDVRHAEERAQLRTRIRHAKWKHLGFWYAWGLAACLATGTLFATELYWAWPIITGVYATCFVLAKTSDADYTYRKAYQAGLSMGVVVAYDAARHARHHAEHGGGEDCEVGVTRAVIPHVWEHKFVMAEIFTASDGAIRIEADDADPDATPNDGRRP